MPSKHEHEEFYTNLNLSERSASKLKQKTRLYIILMHFVFVKDYAACFALVFGCDYYDVDVDDDVRERETIQLLF